MDGLYEWSGVCFRVVFNCLTYTNMRTTIARSVEGLVYGVQSPAGTEVSSLIQSL